MAEDFFHVFGKVRVKHRCRAGFFFVRLRKSDALGDGAAHCLGGMQDRHGPGIVFDHDIRARPHVGPEASQRRSQRLPFLRCGLHVPSAMS